MCTKDFCVCLESTKSYYSNIISYTFNKNIYVYLVHERSLWKIVYVNPIVDLNIMFKLSICN